MTDLVQSIDQICFMDSETRRVAGTTCPNVIKAGGHRYFDNCFATIWSWAVGNAPIEIASLRHGFDGRLSWEHDAPDRLKRFYERAERGEAYFAAWNMAFDRGVWNGPQSDFPPLRIDMTIDVMAQAVAAGCPATLAGASTWLNVAQKMEEGKKLIDLYEPPDGLQPSDRPYDWDRFEDYAIRDSEALRDVYNVTLPLSREEWEVYWASEAINDRGVGLDTYACAAVSVLVDENLARMNERVIALTGGKVTAITQPARIIDFVAPILRDHASVRQSLVKRKAKLGDDGTIIRPEKLSLSRDRLEIVLVYLDVLQEREGLSDELQRVHELLTLRHYGGSATPGKFLKALNVSHGGRLKGQYVFNGAPQTGRFSSRGVQIHNLTRAHLAELEDAALNVISALKDKRVRARVREMGY